MNSLPKIDEELKRKFKSELIKKINSNKEIDDLSKLFDKYKSDRKRQRSKSSSDSKRESKIKTKN